MRKRKSARPRRPANPDGETPASAIDRHVGARIRMARKLRGMSLKRLAALLNLTYQQVQKYERGHNRISAGRLYELISILEVPITFFFEGAAAEPPIVPGAQSDVGADAMLQIDNRETLGLLRAFCAIEDANLRKKILNLVRLLGDSQQEIKSD